MPPVRCSSIRPSRRVVWIRFWVQFWFSVGFSRRWVFEALDFRGIMGLTYFKRYRMEIALTKTLFPPPYLPHSYSLVGWNEHLLEAHAEAKYRSFCFEIDANVFPCLGQKEGCRRLIDEITRRNNFVAEATWLLVYRSSEHFKPEYCGTIQGIRDRHGFGAVQNLGVTPAHRRQGLGTHLLHTALTGFSRIGLRSAYLEVTAQNLGAVRLYEQLGFCRAKTVYKAAEVAFA